MQSNKKIFRCVPAMSLVLAVLLLSACYHRKAAQSAALIQYSERQLDSLSFQSTHHYTNNYNFIVKSDSLVLLKQLPEEMISGLPTDTLVLRRHEHVVVADIRMIPAADTDSVWVQLASDQHTFGWIQETEMLPRVVPDDPISQFISTFSDVHLLIFLVVISIIAVTYWISKLLKQRARIVHFRDIHSFYPTLLCLLVAASAALYASIQMFAPEVWRHFYYHPTLNPFGVPAILAVFLMSVWAMLIVGIATVDDVLRQLPFGEAVQYLSGLLAVCAANYIVYGISTLYYIGYVLLALYFLFAIYRYVTFNRARYVCGHCGATLLQKGRCPHCGALNT